MTDCCKKESKRPNSVDFSAVLETELRRIGAIEPENEKDGGNQHTLPEGNGKRYREVLARASEAKLAGLAFSGGGIRSATFNLGVLQGLARLKLLPVFHYLSTVSGGGYIGGWLQAWLHRRKSLEDIQKDLDPRWIRKAFDAAGKQEDSKAETSGHADHEIPMEAPQIRFLRQFSNYLTPKRGWFGADMWTSIAIYLRNFVLNLLLIVAAFAALLLVCQFVGGFKTLLEGLEKDTFGKFLLTYVLPATLIFLGTFFIVANLRYDGIAPEVWDQPAATSKERRPPGYTQPGFIQLFVILPLFLAALFAAPTLENFAKEETIAWYWWGIVPAAYVALFLLIFVFGVFQDDSLLSEVVPLLKADYRDIWTWRGYFTGVLFGFIGGIGLWLVCHILFTTDFGKPQVRGKAILFPPLVILVVVLTSFLYVGMMGRFLAERRREWWSRLNAFCLVWAVVWIGLMAVALCGPGFMDAMAVKASSLFSGITAGWVISTVAGVIAARNATSAEGSHGRIAGYVATITPYVFIAGLIVLLSWGIAALVHDPATLEGAVRDHSIGRPLVAALALVVFALVVSRLLDVNHFSMHMMYRNRLARCYLGASNSRRGRHPFTGFDRTDDIPLSHLGKPDPGKRRKKDKEDDGPSTHEGPYPIINAALNLVGGRELAWQKRQATSFVFTPEYCGYDLVGIEQERRANYYATEHYASSAYPVDLGMAMAISGAAASPNMGCHTSPATAFLLTVFNLRLGWWIGNPAHRRGRHRSSPNLTLLHLLSEMFGLTSAERDYVYLSDGGHFENLGIYELVKRRCRFVLACDAEQDRNLEFTGLGNAIEKCRADLGVEIAINVDPIRHRSERNHSKWHWAVGTIDYGRPEDMGILVYIKSSLTGDAPEDVLRYAAKNPRFPHQSTADQWFDETQFESYRRLGQHIVEALFEDMLEKDESGNVNHADTTEKLFVDLWKRWYPPAGETAEQFARHAENLTKIFDQLRNDTKLEFLSFQIYPEWRQLRDFYEGSKEVAVRRKSKKGTGTGTEVGKFPAYRDLPGDFEDLRHGFYICNSMIQLMEEVYLDLDLETQHGHPDNRGWMNQFRHWSWSSMFRITWTVCASTYGSRFQTFCERRLGLTLGTVALSEIAIDRRSGELSESKEALNRPRLNLYEKSLVEQITSPAKYRKKASVWAFTINSGRESKLKSDYKTEFPKLVFGFCVLHEGRLLYFRVQDHLRRMGLARLGIHALMEEPKAMKDTPADHLIERLDEEIAAPLEVSEAGTDLLRRLLQSVRAEMRLSVIPATPNSDS